MTDNPLLDVLMIFARPPLAVVSITTGPGSIRR